MEPKKLIEVAMPVKEVSAESVRDKSIRHGHISTLHLWWARRPLPVCRAVVFASLVPDPLDENCPVQFQQAVAKYLADKNYSPYDDIPHTAAIDPMEDNMRNRLLMFIGKFSDEYVANEKLGKKTPSKKQLSDGSLIKWENKNSPEIIGIARKLIFIAHNSLNNGNKADLVTLEKRYSKLWDGIATAEKDLYGTTNRHIATVDVTAKEKALIGAIDAYLDRMPKVFDPFAGGGAIPLEAARLGCRTYGNDINPVAHIIQRGSVEFPQKYGKPITYSRDEFIKRYSAFFKSLENNIVADPNVGYSLQNMLEIEGYEDAKTKYREIKNADYINIKNRLAFDVEYYSRQMLAGAENEIGQYYPTVNGKKPVAYYWAHVGTCSNPSCKAEVPLLGRFYLVNKPGKKVYLNPLIIDNQIEFEIKTGEYKGNGWMARGNLSCPCCGNTTDVKSLKKQFLSKNTSQKLIAVIEEDTGGKNYRLPTKQEIDILNSIETDFERPNEMMPVKYTQALPSCTWGLEKWGQMFSERQLASLGALLKQFKLIEEELLNRTIPKNDYSNSLLTYLGILIDRIAIVNTTFGVWHTGGEKLERPMGRQAIPMVFDFPESNPFCSSSGSALNQIDWLTRYINSESDSSISAQCNNSSSGEISQFDFKSINSVVTDPPYYDAIAYADISDFFYVWLKRTLGNVFPLNFATPQTPKAEECTALKHHHGGKMDVAKKHFENKLQRIFSAIEEQTSGVVSIMFAHQSTEAWTTLCNSILGANMNITGSWANDTEMTGALKTNKAFLSSSVTVACKPNVQEGYAGFKEVKKNIEARIKVEVRELYSNGFRGADLLTACFGKAVSEFGQYQMVEKADGTQVTVAELLEMAREAAFNAIISDIDTDEVTKFYIGWLNLFGFTQAEHDDVMRITQVGLSIEVSLLHQHQIFETSGSKESLSGYSGRNKANQKLGEKISDNAIDKIHKAMALYEGGNRMALINFLAKMAPTNDAPLWRICTALAEVLPVGQGDHKQLSGLIANKESLIREASQKKQETPEQGQLEM
ncbi:DUF1156 domain-containing protein [Draconibacterium sp. IB214405]|uniref:DUF1156 domain-containing protein n=1 Tax=Draconibacterium sp. IB214405 TaxID=3097352 RepID=UPI002A15F57D|nr:DUF1156 domain-containing protein [Draconibacterium sp. IB214405]MDX8340544.1 DUF1156 domain-containing protein [Draconibacterium sp. IB214405]